MHMESPLKLRARFLFPRATAVRGLYISILLVLVLVLVPLVLVPLVLVLCYHIIIRYFHLRCRAKEKST